MLVLRAILTGLLIATVAPLQATSAQVAVPDISVVGKRIEEVRKWWIGAPRKPLVPIEMQLMLSTSGTIDEVRCTYPVGSFERVLAALQARAKIAPRIERGGQFIAWRLNDVNVAMALFVHADEKTVHVTFNTLRAAKEQHRSGSPNLQSPEPHVPLE